MPEVGFEDTPMRPTMRDETTTKATPKIATPERGHEARPEAHVAREQAGHERTA